MALKFNSLCNVLSHCQRIIGLKNPRLPVLPHKAAFYSSRCYEERDPSSIFFSSNVQKILKHITGCDVKKILENDPASHTNELIFATDEDLSERISQAELKAKKFLQMPPVVKLVIDKDEILSVDPFVQGYVKSKHIFTDISEDIPEKDRMVVVRETTGVLRTANSDEKFRMSLIYNPGYNRFLKLAPLFEKSDALEEALSLKEHWFILDFACHQLEPTYAKYHEITSIVYDHIEKNNIYDVLYSTRHFGPMAFYLAWNNKLSGLVVYFIDNDLVVEAASILNIYSIIHTGQELDIDVTSSVDKCIEIIKQNEPLIEMAHTGRIKMAIQRYNERIRKDKTVSVQN